VLSNSQTINFHSSSDRLAVFISKTDYASGRIIRLLYCYPSFIENFVKNEESFENARAEVNTKQ
jgi:hypothetical protein